MGHFLEPLLHDLAERFRFLDDELGRMALPPEVEPLRQRIHQIAVRAKARVDSVLTDPDIASPDFAKNFYHKYKRLSELAQAIDEGPLFALSRFRAEDRFLTAVVRKACRAVKYPDDTPICAAMSSQYYCAMTEMDLILVPHGEATHLLGWADLYHELGHFIASRNEAVVIRPLMELVSNHFEGAIEQAHRQGWSAASIEELRQFRNLWLGDWIVEFACDLFATFATRLSFAWSNLRLCARMSTDVFGTIKSHPADAARTQAIFEMLALVSDGTDKTFIEDRWRELIGTIGAVEPHSFRMAYPETLLKALAQQSKDSFERLGLKAYTPNSCAIADLLNEAWRRFQSDPESYADWERNEVGELRKQLGLDV